MGSIYNKMNNNNNSNSNKEETIVGITTLPEYDTFLSYLYSSLGKYLSNNNCYQILLFNKDEISPLNKLKLSNQNMDVLAFVIDSLDSKNIKDSNSYLANELLPLEMFSTCKVVILARGFDKEGAESIESITNKFEDSLKGKKWKVIGVNNNDDSDDSIYEKIIKWE